MALWLALVGMTLQAFAPLVHAAIICGLRSVQSPNLQILCSIDGFSVVDWSRIENGDGAAGNPIGFHIPADGAQGKFKDPYCCGGGPVMLSAIEPSIAPAPALRAGARPAMTPEPMPDTALPWSHGQPRAPPT